MTRAEPTYALLLSCYSASFAFAVPIYSLFLLSLGLDLFEINLVFAVYLVTSSIFEVPTGAFADLVGRKASFIASCVLRATAYALYFSARGLTDCMLAEFVDAVGAALASGALDAWAVDCVRSEGHAGPIDRLFARAQGFSISAMTLAGVSGAYAATRDMARPWLLGTAAFVATSVVALYAMDERSALERRRTRSRRPSVLATARDGLRTVLATPVLRLMGLLSAAIAFAAMPTFMLWPKRMVDLTGQGAWIIGWLWACLNVPFVLGSTLVPRLPARWRRAHAMISTAAWRSAALALAAASTSAVPTFTGLLLYNLGAGVGAPLLQAWANEHIEAHQRATLLSVQAMFFTLGGASGLVCLGLLARACGIPLALFVSAAVLALTVPGFMALGRRSGAAGE